VPPCSLIGNYESKYQKWKKILTRMDVLCASSKGAEILLRLCMDKSKMMIKRFNAPLGADLLVKPFPIFA
jgi:hypothetical protein